METETKRERITRIKLNLVIFIGVFNMITLAMVVGSINQVNRNVNKVDGSCSLKLSLLEQAFDNKTIELKPIVTNK